MKISLIAAIGRNNELGKENKLLWDLPADMQYFRKTTAGHVVIMGRKTYESIGQPLPNRRNIVVTRQSDYKPEGMEVAGSLEEALKLVTENGAGWDDEVFVIGGGELYSQAIDMADKLYITRVDDEIPEADTYFPDFGPEWSETTRELHEPDEKNLHPYAFMTYEKTAN